MPDRSPSDASLDLRILRLRDYRRVDPDLVLRLRGTTFVPFVVEPDFGPRYAEPLDAGTVPPTFRHSWAVRLRGITRFRLHAEADGLALNWAGGDLVSIYVPETGQRVDFTSEASLRGDLVTLTPRPGTAGAPAYPDLVYVMLRTSAHRYVAAGRRDPRRFRLDGLTTSEVARDRSALLVGDTLNYDTSSAPNQLPWFRDGEGEAIFHPWRQGPNTDPRRLCPEPRREDGWYLVGRFTGPPTLAGEPVEDSEPVWALVYYNEQQSRLRLYLLPKISRITGLDVRLRLLARDPDTPAGYVALQGAFFDDDPRPRHWGEAHLVVPGVELNRWVMVETNVLFPMAERLPTMKDTSFTAGDPSLPPDAPDFPERKDWYVPLYDCEFESTLGNIRLSVEITPFLRGTADLDFVGRGVGMAVQQMAGSGISPFSALKDTIESGIGAYKAASSIYDYIKGEYKKDHPNAALPGALAVGAGAFAGPAAAVGAAITLVTLLLKEEEPLRMAIELQLRGAVTGTIYTPLSRTVYDVYLPGRFDAEEMHAVEGVPLHIADLDQYLPRFDRSVGHLGYRYDPSRLKLPMIYFGPYGDEPSPGFNEGIVSCSPEYWKWAMRCVWPAPERPAFPYSEFEDAAADRWTLRSADYPARTPGFLPLVFNEYADIVPVDPGAAQRTQLPQQSTTPRQRTHYYIGNTAFAAHLEPAPGDGDFPASTSELGPVGAWSLWVYRGGDWTAYDAPIEEYIGCLNPTAIEKGDGYWLDAGPGRRLRPLRDFDHFTDVRTNGFGQLSIIRYDLEHVSLSPGVEDVDFFPEDLLAKHFRPYQPGEAWPIYDAVFQWDVSYLYYGRSRQQPSGTCPRASVQRRLRAPVTVSVQRLDCDYGIERFSWAMPGGDAPSVSLIDKPW